jgi:hypothetical protein
MFRTPNSFKRNKRGKDKEEGTPSPVPFAVEQNKGRQKFHGYYGDTVSAFTGAATVIVCGDARQEENMK